MPIIRTPNERFTNLPYFPFAPHYIEVNGLHVHYIDEGLGEVILCLHGEPSWSFLYRKVLPVLADQGLRFRLAVSLHAATDAQRSKLMPVNQRFPLEQLLRAIRHHVERTGRRVTFEYILLEELNDSVADAARLVRLVAQLPCKINLIPYNPIGPGKFKRPSPERIERFAEYLRPRVPAVTVRYSQGVEIGAACGQLAGETET